MDINDPNKPTAPNDQPRELSSASTPEQASAQTPEANPASELPAETPMTGALETEHASSETQSSPASPTSPVSPTSPLTPQQTEQPASSAFTNPWNTGDTNDSYNQAYAQPAQATQPFSEAQPTSPVNPVPYQQTSFAEPPLTPPSPTGALVCGVLAIVFCLAPFVGIILGIIAIVLGNKYVRSGGTEGTGKAGRICGIIGVILSTLVLILCVVFIVIGLSVLDMPLTDYSSSRSSTSSIARSYDEGDLDGEDAAAIRELIEPRLEHIRDRNPETMVSLETVLRMELDAELDDPEYVDTIDLGSFINVMATPFDFEYGYVDLNERGNEAEVLYWITMKDSLDFSNIFEDLLADYENTVDIDTLTIEQLDADYNAMLLQAAERAETTSSQLILVDLTKKGGTWVIDEDSWNSEMASLFL